MQIGTKVKVVDNIFNRLPGYEGVIIGLDQTLPGYGKIKDLFIVSFPTVPMSHNIETSPYRYFRDELKEI